MTDNNEEYFAFEYRDEDGKKYYTRVTGNYLWSDVLEDFVRFLEGIYKYNIKDQIRLQQPPWLDFRDNYDMWDPWINHYFEIDEDDEEEEINEDSCNSGHTGA